MFNDKNQLWHFPSKIYIIIGILLLIAIMPLPYGFYTLLRIAVCGISIVIVFKNFEISGLENLYAWFFLLVAILFNPLIPIHINKEIWVIIDAITALIFFFLAYKTHTNID